MNTPRDDRAFCVAMDKTLGSPLSPPISLRDYLWTIFRPRGTKFLDKYDFCELGAEEIRVAIGDVLVRDGDAYVPLALVPSDALVQHMAACGFRLCDKRAAHGPWLVQFSRRYWLFDVASGRWCIDPARAFPEERRIANARRLSGSLVRAIRKELREAWEADGVREYACAYCHAPVAWDRVVLDHIDPISRGGRNVRENIAYSCRFCNGSKGCKTLQEWKGWKK